MYTMNKKPIQAIAVFNQNGINGTIVFIEDLDNNCVHIDIQLYGLNKNAQHGFHVHESGDLSAKCESMCAHFKDAWLSRNERETRWRSRKLSNQ